MVLYPSVLSLATKFRSAKKCFIFRPRPDGGQRMWRPPALSPLVPSFSPKNAVFFSGPAQTVGSGYYIAAAGLAPFPAAVDDHAPQLARVALAFQALAAAAAAASAAAAAAAAAPSAVPSAAGEEGEGEAARARLDRSLPASSPGDEGDVSAARDEDESVSGNEDEEAAVISALSPAFSGLALQARLPLVISKKKKFFCLSCSFAPIAPPPNPSFSFTFPIMLFFPDPLPERRWASTLAPQWVAPSASACRSSTCAGDLSYP